MSKSTFPQPKFEEGQRVKFTGDSDGQTGQIQSISYDSASGYSYRITSKYYDQEKNDMVEGLKICNESEIVDMTDAEEAQENGGGN